MKAKLLRRIRKRYYWYCGDIFDFESLCECTVFDTGITPDINYANKYWKATLYEVVIYYTKIKLYVLKCKIKNILNINI